jgi:WhiB family redox-sensing transcriptional regulator
VGELAGLFPAGLGTSTRFFIFSSDVLSFGRFLCARDDDHLTPLNKEKTMDWRDSAACLTVDPELFFPVGNTGPAVDQIEKAKAVCARCTVTEQCLQYALETSQDSGVWGGLSEDERRALKRRAARARRAS